MIAVVAAGLGALLTDQLIRRIGLDSFRASGAVTVVFVGFGSALGSAELLSYAGAVYAGTFVAMGDVRRTSSVQVTLAGVGCGLLLLAAQSIGLTQFRGGMGGGAWGVRVLSLCPDDPRGFNLQAIDKSY